MYQEGSELTSGHSNLFFYCHLSSDFSLSRSLSWARFGKRQLSGSISEYSWLFISHFRYIRVVLEIFYSNSRVGILKTTFNCTTTSQNLALGLVGNVVQMIIFVKTGGPTWQEVECVICVQSEMKTRWIPNEVKSSIGPTIEFKSLWGFPFKDRMWSWYFYQ